MEMKDKKLDNKYDLQQTSLFSHLHPTGSFRQIELIIAPQPTHVLFDLLQAQ